MRSNILCIIFWSVLSTSQGQTFTQVDSVVFPGFLQKDLYAISNSGQYILTVSVMHNNQKLLIYKPSGEGQSLSPIFQKPIVGTKVTAILFSKNDEYLYLGTNKGLLTYKFNQQSGALTQLSSYYFFNFGSEEYSLGDISDIAISNDSKYLIVLGGGSYSIITLEIKSPGEWRPVSIYDELPLHLLPSYKITMHPNGVEFYVNHQNGCVRLSLKNGVIADAQVVCDFAIDNFSADFTKALNLNANTLYYYAMDENKRFQQKDWFSIYDKFGERCINLYVDAPINQMLVSSSNPNLVFLFEINPSQNKIEYRKKIKYPINLNFNPIFDKGQSILYGFNTSKNYILKYKVTNFFGRME